MCEPLSSEVRLIDSYTSFDESSVFKIAISSMTWNLDGFFDSLVVRRFACLGSHVALIRLPLRGIFLLVSSGSMAIPYAFLFAITACCYCVFLATLIYMLRFEGDFFFSHTFVEDIMCRFILSWIFSLVLMMKFDEILKLCMLLCFYIWKLQGLCYLNHCILPLWCSSMQLGFRKCSFEFYVWMLIIEVWVEAKREKKQVFTAVSAWNMPKMCW